MREIKFERTVWADMQLSKLCPNQNINKLGHILSGDDSYSILVNTLKVIQILSQAYERKQKHLNKDYVENPITWEELENLTEDEIEQLQTMACAQMAEDAKTTIEAEPKKESE